jgi:hypothetical protein
LGLPPRSFAADAYACIMVAIRTNGSTEYKIATRYPRPMANSPRSISQLVKHETKVVPHQRIHADDPLVEASGDCAGIFWKQFEHDKPRR